MGSDKIMIIPIPERELNNNYEIGQEVSIDYKNKNYYGKIIKMYHDPEFFNFNIIIKVTGERDLLENDK